MLWLLVQVTDICDIPALNCLQTSITLLHIVVVYLLMISCKKNRFVVTFMKMSLRMKWLVSVFRLSLFPVSYLLSCFPPYDLNFNFSVPAWQKCRKAQTSCSPHIQCVWTVSLTLSVCVSSAGRVRTRRTSAGNGPSVTDSRGRSRGKVVSQSQRE